MKCLLLRFALTFLAGALLFDVGHRLPSNGLAAACCAVAVVLAMTTLDFKAMAIVPLAYATVWFGIHLPVHIPGEWDVSYGMYIYGFVVQQVLAAYSWQRHGFLAYVILSLAGTAVLAVELSPGRTARLEGEALDTGAPSAARPRAGVTRSRATRVHTQ